MDSISADVVIVFVYLAAVTAMGIALGRQRQSVQDYFLGDRRIPWFAVSLSIVATETSTLTFISIPGIAYIADLSFLQLAFGYVIGRVIIALTFLPAYFQGELFTTYQLLQRRFGRRMQIFASLLFLATRTLADGVRLYATAIPLALITGWHEILCILIIAVCTILYTYFGGIKSVVWMDVIQSITYVGGALLVVLVLWRALPPDWITRIPLQKWRLFVPGFGSGFWQINYTTLSGLIGGAFLSMASHGTDQLIVQRVLSCRDLRSGQKALAVSGIIIVLQFALFLFLGVMLYAHFQGADIRPDQVLPQFVVEQLPPIISGLIVASIFAAAMSTLSSSLNSLASSTLFDLLAPDSSTRGIRFSRWATLFWGLVLVGGALFFRTGSQPLVELGLGIASFTYGGVLGVFFLSSRSGRTGEDAAICALWSALYLMIWVNGMAGWVETGLVTLAGVAGVWLLSRLQSRHLRIFVLLWFVLILCLMLWVDSPRLAWTWLVAAGSAVTVLLGRILSRCRG